MDEHLHTLYQHSWIFECINRKTSRKKGFSGQVIKPRVVESIGVAPIVRINRFVKSLPNNDISAVVSDATHRVFAVFKYKPAIMRFENKYRQRVTDQTVNCLVHITNANLIFVSRSSAHKDYGVTSMDSDIVVLEIMEVDIFDRDQQILTTKAERGLKYVYEEANYMRGGEREDGDEDADEYSDVKSI